MTTFFATVLPKKYTNPSSDIIAVLAGLDHVDQIFTDFVSALDAIIRNGKTRECFPTPDHAPVPSLRRDLMLIAPSRHPAEGRRGGAGHYFGRLPD